MESSRPMQLAVESPCRGTSVVRVAGAFTAAAAPRLLRLLNEVSCRPGSKTVFVDLGNVLSFEVGGVEVLHQSRRCLRAAGVRMVLANLDGHRRALPRRICDALDGLDSVADLEDAGVGV